MTRPEIEPRSSGRLANCQDYVLRASTDLMKENDLILEKVRSRRYPAQIIPDAGYTDDIALLVNTPTLAKSLLHSLEWAASGIGIQLNVDKTEYMCFNKRPDTSTLNDGPLKLVKFTCLRSSVSMPEMDINTRLWRCPWCNGYRRRKWTRWHEFKSWTRLIAFHIALIPLGKVWIQLFFLRLWANSRAD